MWTKWTGVEEILNFGFWILDWKMKKVDKRVDEEIVDEVDEVDRS
jgi:hypothetical protein